MGRVDGYRRKFVPKIQKSMLRLRIVDKTVQRRRHKIKLFITLNKTNDFRNCVQYSERFTPPLQNAPGLFALFLRERMITQRHIEEQGFFQNGLEVTEGPEAFVAVVSSHAAVTDAAEGCTG